MKGKVLGRQAIRATVLVVLLAGPTGSAADTPEEADTPSAWPQPVDTSVPYYSVQVDQLEWRGSEGPDAFRWDLQGWWGTDKNKFWVKSEGEANTSGPSAGDAEVQLLYSRMISRFFDFQVGVRQDFLYGPGPNRDRTFAVFGFDGLAPYWFEVESSLFVSDEADVSFRLATTYDVYVTQRLVAQPRFELNAALEDASGFGVQSGVNDVELGLRLRYELRREFAPYVGVSWNRLIGDTADLARSDGEDTDVLSFVAGIRIQF